MKKYELKELYDVEKISIKSTITKIFISYQHDLKYYILLFLSYFVINSLYNRVSDSINNKFGLFVNIFIGIISLIIAAYFTLSINKQSNFKVLSLERLNRAVTTLRPQIKTILSEILKSIPYILLASVISGVLMVALMLIFKFEPTVENTYPLVAIMGVSMILILSQFFYCTYITILFDIDGFDAVKLSQFIYKKNKVITTILFIIQIGFPILSYLLYEKLNLPFNIIIIIGFINILLSFFIINFVAFILPNVLIKKEKTNEVLEVQ